MLEDALWTELYSDEQIRNIEAVEKDPELQRAINELLDIVMS